ncbi:hypothetical protein SAMN05518865_108155 [Duganella sp. CF458]|uniref:hypothetical protein n=1 Tax=Duganella sp. CF458 TaxID=1884368 RepID=UPI0008EAD564|nr:hypothetical protein [Duganella sp. CF458]SFG10938.1 hypothetical protein SAMN05518865_108155 [Duganella sp. CF458]
MSKVRKMILLACVAACASNAQAYKLDPWAFKGNAKAAAEERAKAMRELGAEKGHPNAFFDPVHEQMTLRSLAQATATGTAGVELEKLAATDSGRSLLYGVRWNDSPYVVRTGAMYLFCKLKLQATNSLPCWGSQMLYGKTHPKVETDDPTLLAMIVRSHFYDMQFLHAMSEEKVAATEVREKILMWAELVALIQAGLVVDDTRLEQVVPMLSTNARFHWAKIFPSRPHLRDNKNMAKWRVGTMFRADRDRAALNLKDVALGSFLHIVQDSYAGGHVEREVSEGGSFAWGTVKEFHSYQGQDGDWHNCHDRNPINGAWAAAMGEPRNPVNVGANIIRILRAARPATDDGMEEMRSRVSATFLNLANPGQESTTGNTRRPSCA